MARIHEATLIPLLGPLAGRFDVDALATVDSTSSEAARRADQGAPSGLVIVADQQTAGRGRRGRTWQSDPEDSLTFSVLWRFAGPLTQLAGLSLTVGVAVTEALESLGVSGLGLKWPNDILLASPQGVGKLGGVLIELSSDRRGVVAIIGIGLNLRSPPGDWPFPVAGLDHFSLERHTVLAAILRCLAPRLEAHAQVGFRSAQADWARRHLWHNQPVRVLDAGQTKVAGLCRGADVDGALLLETDYGIERVLAGDVSLREENA